MSYYSQIWPWELQPTFYAFTGHEVCVKQEMECGERKAGDRKERVTVCEVGEEVKENSVTKRKGRRGGQTSGI